MHQNRQRQVRLETGWLETGTGWRLELAEKLDSMTSNRDQPCSF